MRIKDDTKREAIMEKTIAIVFEKGFAGIKMADLAKRVGISVSTLYVYFKNKEDLIVSISGELFKKVSEMSSKEVTDDLPYKLKLKALWLYWVNYSINHTKETSFIHQVKQSPYYDKIPPSILEAKHKIGMDLFELGKKEGLIKNMDNEILASIIGALLNEYVKLINNNKIKMDQKNTDAMFSMVWDAIKN